MSKTRYNLCVVLTLVAYVAVHSFCINASYFSMDDFDELAYIQRMSNYWQLLRVDAFSLFRPVKNIMFAIFSFFGNENIMVSRMLAIAIGVVTYFPVLLFCRRVFDVPAASIAAAAIYLLAPTQVSCVAWLSCINIQIMAGFCAMAIVLHDDGRYYLASLFYALALCSYECAITLPGIMLLQDLLLRPGRHSKGWRTQIKPYLFYAATCVLYLAVRTSFSGTTNVHGSFPYDVSRAQIAFASASFLWNHLFTWFWPFGGMAVMGYFSPWTASSVKLGICWILPIILLAVAIWCRKRRPVVSFGLLTFFAGYLPVSNITGIGNGPYGDYYLALAGLGLAVAYTDVVCMCMLACRRYKLIGFVALILITIRLCAVPESARYAYLWGNDVLAYESGARAFPASVNNRMMQLIAISRVDESGLTKSLEDIEPELDKAHESKTGLYLLRALYAGNVRKDYAQAIEAVEDYRASLVFPPKGMAWYHYFKGCIVEDLGGDLDAAGEEYLKSIVVESPDRNFALYYDRAARYLAIKGDVKRAIELWREALFWDETRAAPHFNISIALEQIGAKDEAAWHRQRAQELSSKVNSK
ncbi:MAG: tetratricopeptide repeat protein [Kiritimatiellae bacterium]|nr:tetratricopeptide repeat protein [Kiritimatiellia bacterium]